MPRRLKTQQDFGCGKRHRVSLMNGAHKFRPFEDAIHSRRQMILIVLAGMLASLPGVAAFAQSPSPPQQDAIAIEGTVRNSAGELVSGAAVFLEEKNHSGPIETMTKTDGTFVLLAPRPGIYSVSAKKPGWRDAATDSLVLSAGEKKHVELILESLGLAHPSLSGASPSSGSSPGAMEFDDKPNFAVAGITDRANAGGHGSDASLRTSEALAKDTLALKSSGPDGISAGTHEGMAKGREGRETENKLRAALAQAPGSFEANYHLGEFYFASERYREAIPLLEAAYHIDSENHANAYDLALAYRASGDLARAREQVQKMLANMDGADEHRLLGDLDERSGDPLQAVREFERAVRMEPSEPNYFEWGTELLLHGAVRPAVEVFTKGSGAHPLSSRMLVGLGAALYASGSFDAAAQRLCEASDLKPADPTPYLYLGKMEKAAPTPLPCIEQKLARFATDHPENALANYYYAMALWKREKGSGNSAALQETETLLEKAVVFDPKLGEAYLQLGVLFSARGEFEKAVHAYEKAVEVSPRLSEAHYRLARAYKRKGEEAQSRQEFQLYEQTEKAETAAVERERRELQHFLVILKDQPPATPPR
jgi:tetratricopeptide (TPR) repeat protein